MTELVAPVSNRKLNGPAPLMLTGTTTRKCSTVVKLILTVFSSGEAALAGSVKAKRHRAITWLMIRDMAVTWRDREGDHWGCLSTHLLSGRRLWLRAHPVPRW